ncbi:hypothetical protein ACW9HQ_42220 [Nocardia gipuzkoensis]
MSRVRIACVVALAVVATGPAAVAWADGDPAGGGSNAPAATVPDPKPVPFILGGHPFSVPESVAPQP